MKSKTSRAQLDSQASDERDANGSVSKRKRNEDSTRNEWEGLLECKPETAPEESSNESILSVMTQVLSTIKAVSTQLDASNTMLHTLVAALSTTTNKRWKATDDNIRQAVRYWHKYPEKAEKLFGMLNEWDTSEVTNMSGLFKDINKFDGNMCSIQSTIKQLEGGQGYQYVMHV